MDISDVDVANEAGHLFAQLAKAVESTFGDMDKGLSTCTGALTRPLFIMHVDSFRTCVLDTCSLQQSWRNCGTVTVSSRAR